MGSTPGPDLTPGALLAWVDGYERAWRASGTDALASLFAVDAVYLPSPYAEPVTGLPAIQQFWDEQRSGPDEVFTMGAEAVSCSGDTGVARVLVRYGEPVRQEYLDLWVVRFDADGLVTRFEEWPFWPTHGIAPTRAAPVALDASTVEAPPYGEWVRSPALSSGIYRLTAGGHDGQTPHDEDEVYVVLAGEAVLDVDGGRTPVRAGSVAYVPRRVPHAFIDITADLEVAVVFAPPETPTGG